MRLENTWQEIRDHSFIQNLSRPFTDPCWCFFSSVHLTHFLQGSGQKTGMTIAEAWFCAQGLIFVLLSGGKIQTWPIIRFLTESVTYWFRICWYLIESIMPICPGPPAEIYAHNIKNTAVYLIVHMGYFLSLCLPNPSWVFAAKNSFFCFIWP